MAGPITPDQLLGARVWGELNSQKQLCLSQLQKVVSFSTGRRLVAKLPIIGKYFIPRGIAAELMTSLMDRGVTPAKAALMLKKSGLASVKATQTGFEVSAEKLVDSQAIKELCQEASKSKQQLVTEMGRSLSKQVREKALAERDVTPVTSQTGKKRVRPPSLSSESSSITKQTPRKQRKRISPTHSGNTEPQYQRSDLNGNTTINKPQKQQTNTHKESKPIYQPVRENRVPLTRKVEPPVQKRVRTNNTTTAPLKKTDTPRPSQPVTQQPPVKQQTSVKQPPTNSNEQLILTRQLNGIFRQMQTVDPRLTQEHFDHLVLWDFLSEYTIEKLQFTSIEELTKDAGNLLQLPPIKKAVVKQPSQVKVEVPKPPQSPSDEELARIPQNFFQLYQALLADGVVKGSEDFLQLYKEIKPSKMLAPEFPSQLKALNRLKEFTPLTPKDYGKIINREMLVSEQFQELNLTSDTQLIHGIALSVKDNIDVFQVRMAELQTRRAKLASQLQAQALKVQPVSPDGNCFFHAIGLQCGEAQEFVRERVHRTASNLLKSHQGEFNITDGWLPRADLQEQVNKGHIEQSAQGNTPNQYWGSSEHAPIVALAYNRPVVCYSDHHGSKPICYDANGRKTSYSKVRKDNPIRLSLQGNHWDAIVPEKGIAPVAAPQNVKTSRHNELVDLMKEVQMIKPSREAPNQTLPGDLVRDMNEKAQVTNNEIRELQLYKVGVDSLREEADDKNANCQGFANSVEYFLRGMGYHHVYGTNYDMNLSDGPDDMNNEKITPIAGWTPWNMIEKGQEFTTEADLFSKMSNQNQALRGDRFIFLKVSSMKNKAGVYTNAAGHYANLVRLKSGRLAVIDAQSKLFFPVLNPNGTPTPRAKEYFKSCRVQLLPVDHHSNDDFQKKVDDATAFLKQGKVSEELMDEARRLDDLMAESIRRQFQQNHGHRPSEDEFANEMRNSPGGQALSVLRQRKNEVEMFFRSPKGGMEPFQQRCRSLAQQIKTIQEWTQAVG